MSSPNAGEWTVTCCWPTGLINPTFSNRFCRPLMRASEVGVLPTCCLVAATKMGRGRLVEIIRENDLADILVGMELVWIIGSMS